jgi:hypothetical protein
MRYILPEIVALPFGIVIIFLNFFNDEVKGACGVRKMGLNDSVGKRDRYN